MQANSIKRLWLILSIFILGLPTVVAQGAFDNLGGTMQKMFGPILLLQFGVGSFVFWAKFLVWVLVFALLYAVSFKVPVLRERKNVSIVTAIILALMTVIPLSGELLKSLFQTYAIMVSFVLFFVPIGGVMYLAHHLFRQHIRLHYAMKAILFYLLAVIIANVTNTFTATFDVANFKGMAGLAMGVCFLMFIWNFFRALLGGPEESPRQNIANNPNTPGWLGNLLGGDDAPRPNQPGQPNTPLPPNLGQALRVIQNSIRDYENIFNALPGAMDQMLAMRQTELFPPPGAPPFNVAQLDQLAQNIYNIIEDLFTRGATINNMIQQLRANNPQMTLADERRLTDLAGLWQARLFIFNNYYARAMASYTRGGGPIGRP